MKTKTQQNGFTLVEMVVILTGIAVLLTIAISATMAGVMP
jgi:competence protein ComGC